jgi:S1-C subfamily serine protease
MSNEPEQSTKKQTLGDGTESREALIFTPISIARARHAASRHNRPVGELTRHTTAETTATVDTETPVAEITPERPRDAADQFNIAAFLVHPGGCLLVSLLAIAFAVGGVLGGVIGGGMLLWAGNGGSISLGSTPTATHTPLPTPAPAETPTPSPTPQPPSTASPSDVIESVLPSVVTVINQQVPNFAPQTDEGRVVGSGVVVDSRGYIATNNHVVDNPGELKVMLADGRETVAELVAANPAEDLAILKIEITGIPAIEWANSRNVRPGQVVYAIGSPLGDFPSSVSFGIISGQNRALEIDNFVIDGLIQTDAAINRGSSGGPLITPEGKVIGINTFIIRESEERGIAEGIAFAIPSEKAKNLLIPWIAAHTGESVPIPAAEESK